MRRLIVCHQLYISFRHYQRRNYSWSSFYEQIYMYIRLCILGIFIIKLRLA
jgi:hypothetical protein